MSNGSNRVKAGPVTLALGLVAVGTALLIYNLGGIKSVQFLWRLWPLLLIGVGVEYFVKRSSQKDKDVYFHIPSLILIALIIMGGSIAYTATGMVPGIKQLMDSGIWNNMGPSYQKAWQGEPLAVTEGKTVLQIEQGVGDVRLHPSSDEKLYFNAVFTAPDTPDGRAKANESALSIKKEGDVVRVISPEYQFAGGKGLQTSLDIQVPTGVTVQVAGNVGRVEATGLGGRLKVNTGVGSIKLDKIQGDIDAESGTGRIELTDPGANVKLKTNLGRVDFKSNLLLNKNYELSSNTGSITMELPGVSDLTLDARADLGSVHVAGDNIPLPRDKRSAHLILGSGSGKADLSVKTGSVSIVVNGNYKGI